jgi:hypothetical protein
MVYFAAAESTTWQPHVRVLQADWVDVETRGSCTSTSSDWLCEVLVHLGRALPVNVYALLAAFFFVSFVAELAYACRVSQRWRWLEYACSSALQFFAIEVLSNVLNLEAAVFGAVLVASLQVYGYLIERELERLQPVAKLKGKVWYKMPVATHEPTAVAVDCALWLALGFTQLVVAWVPVFYHFARSDAPWWVWLIVVGSFVMYCLFGVVMILRVTRGWSAQSADYGFTALSLLAKLLVAWVYYGGTYMRKGHVLSNSNVGNGA